MSRVFQYLRDANISLLRISSHIKADYTFKDQMMYYGFRHFHQIRSACVKNNVKYSDSGSLKLPVKESNCCARRITTVSSRLTNQCIDGDTTEANFVPSKKSNDEDPWYFQYDPSTLEENVYGTSMPPCIDKDKDALAIDKKKTKSSESDKSEQQPVQSKDKHKRKKSTGTKCEHLEKKERDGYFLRSLRSYLQVCGNANFNQQAHNCLLHYRYKKEMLRTKCDGIDVDTYNALLNCWAANGNLEKFKVVLSFMEKDGIVPNIQTHAAHLECLSRCEKPTEIQKAVENIAHTLNAEGKSFHDIYQQCMFHGDQIERIQKVVSSHLGSQPNYNMETSNTIYSCSLLKKLNKNNSEVSVLPHINDSILAEDIKKLMSRQMKLESDYMVRVKSVNSSNDVSEKILLMRKHVKKCEDEFLKQLSSTLDTKLDNMRRNMKGKRTMALYPYLHIIDKDILINLMLQEIRWIIESAEYFSPSLKILCQNMGSKVMNFYFIWLRQKNKVTDKVSFIHTKYLEYLKNPELSRQYLPREYWEHLKQTHFEGPTIDVPYVRWPHHITYEVGKFMYDIMLRHLLFDVNCLKNKCHHKMMVPPFYTIYERTKKVSLGQYNFKLSLEIRAHPKISKLYREANLSDLEFEISMMPMMCPPRPWTMVNAGGLLMTQTPFIRLPSVAHYLNDFYTQVPKSQLYPCFDSLNAVSLCPWIINKPVLDLVIEVFRSNGCEELDIPLNPTVHFVLPEPKSNMTDAEKKAVRRERVIMKKKKMETTSLWFDCLYKLSIANKFRDEIFWFPHNLDFRGRVYPTPPHFNHLGSDMVRSILLFAEGKPLGKKGLNWLLTHLINLTGLKKREPNAERLRYAHEIMPDILDSADNPFTGKMWWKNSDEPWQTLACCKEVAKAMRSGDPVNYVSHFPIHQDGSCNGLQHYAALGRDEYGAREVNLAPSDCPQDVYSGVAGLVESERKKEAKQGNEVAGVLDGFIKRKVVKQTIMTFVYGVTEYGAKLQILKQLKDLDQFPQHHCNSAARYLTKKTFLSIQKMFTATREIQKWFTNCAELISKITGEPVEWITPLGLPVIQPYHKKTIIRSLTDIAKGNVSLYSAEYESSYASTFEKFKLPNVRKQKNAFAPNFIHSLDSSHMMLTALYSQRAGITFVSVHDCYWTHPSTVEIMNKICREQFVSLHSEPILENLSEFFLKRYVEQLRDLTENKKQIENLKVVLGNVPEKGTFNLDCILDSVYFFS